MSAHVVSKKRVVAHGEVYTPEREVDAMVSLVSPLVARIEANVLEPACGTGNFLVAVLKRKLRTVQEVARYNRIRWRTHAFLALASCYGVDILADNVETCRRRLCEEVHSAYAGLHGLPLPGAYADSLKYVVARNIVHGDFLTGKTENGWITFPEWGAPGFGLVKRRDFLLRDQIEKGDDAEPVTVFPYCTQTGIVHAKERTRGQD